MTRPQNPGTRFARYVGVADARGCKPWTGYAVLTGTGPRGRFMFEGRNQWASRVAWQLAKGPIPAGLFVCHECDNGLCVNFAHLFLGTAADNNQDKAAKGRTSRYWATRAHCKRGHTFDTSNTKTYTNPTTGKTCRFCRACLKLNSDIHNRAKARRVKH